MKVNCLSGISGQLGSVLAKNLLDNGETVIGFSPRRSTPNRQRLDFLGITNHPNLILSEGDLCDSSFIYSLIDKWKFDRFWNTGAQSHVHCSFENPQSTTEINSVGVIHVLEGIRKFSPQTSLLHCATSECFGKSYDIINGKKVQNENTSMVPCSPYGSAKLNSLHNVRIWRESYGLNVRSAIMFNYEAASLRGHNFLPRKVCLYIKKLKDWLRDNPHSNNFPVLSLGNLYSFRDWNALSDTISGLKLMMDNPPDEFVISSGETHSVEEFVIEAFRVGGLGDYKKYVVIDEKLKRPLEVDYLCGDSSKLKALGWSSKVSFYELVEDMVLNETGI